MIANVTMAFQTAAITGEGSTQFLPDPRYVTFRVTGNGPVSAGAVTIECCPGNMTSTLPPGQTDTGSGKIFQPQRCGLSSMTATQPLKYCPHTEPTLENCGSPTLRFGEALDFPLPFCPGDLFAWPATL